MAPGANAAVVVTTKLIRPVPAVSASVAAAGRVRVQSHTPPPTPSVTVAGARTCVPGVQQSNTRAVNVASSDSPSLSVTTARSWYVRGVPSGSKCTVVALDSSSPVDTNVQRYDTMASPVPSKSGSNELDASNVTPPAQSTGHAATPSDNRTTGGSVALPSTTGTNAAEQQPPS